jgi:uncharacterized membrane protein
MAITMDPALFIAAAVFFGLVTIALWVHQLLRSRNAKNEREVGYRRSEIHIDAAAVPEFRPTWRELRDKGEAR